MRSSLSQRPRRLGSPDARGEWGQPCPRWHVPQVQSSPASPEWGMPHRRCPTHGPMCQGLQGAASGVLGFVRAGATVGRSCRTGWGHHSISPPASLLLPPETACSTFSLCCSMSTQRGTCRGKGTVPWLPGFNGAVWSGPCPVHREWDCMSQHSLPQPQKISGCWRLRSPACTPARGCQKWETSHSSSASPVGASQAAKRLGLVLAWVDPRHRSWTSPCSLSAGNKGPFLVDEWAQCVQPPTRPLQPQTSCCWVAGPGSGVPCGHGAAGQLFRERAWPSQCSRSPLCHASQSRGSPGVGGDTKRRNDGTWPAPGLFTPASPPCSQLSPTPCPLWGQLCGVALEMLLLVPCHRPPRLQPRMVALEAVGQQFCQSRLEPISLALATDDCGDALARWHSRLAYLMMFSSIDKSIIDDTLSWTWQSSVHAPIISIK